MGFVPSKDERNLKGQVRHSPVRFPTRGSRSHIHTMYVYW